MARGPLMDRPVVCRLTEPNVLLILALLAGGVTGWWQQPLLLGAADLVSQLFINLLRLVSLPILFLSIVATSLGMDNAQEVRRIGGRVLRYTLLTTIVAATTALVLLLIVDPVHRGEVTRVGTAGVAEVPSYFGYLLQAVPANFLKPFVDNNVFGVLFLAMAFSCASLGLPQGQRRLLFEFFQGLFAAVMRATGWLIKIMPLGIWSFIVLFINDLRAGLEIESLAFYLLCIVLANLLQAFVFLPLLLRWKGISVMRMVKGMGPALSLAFFSKSSGATLPLALECAIERVGIDKRIARFSLPLCTTINMNGCAAFILTTVLFVSMSHGVHYTLGDMLVWVFIATMAAIGNASVPMGCYFLSSALLAAMNIPLHILGVILPFYTLIDMLETSINVWSDSCVTAVVDKELGDEEWVATTSHVMEASM